MELLLLASIIISCKDFLKIDPPVDQIDTEKVYSNDETAISAVRGLYVRLGTLGSFSFGGDYSLVTVAGRSADEFTDYSTAINYLQFTQNNLTPLNTNMRTNLWQHPYSVIYAANSIIENLERSNVTGSVKQQLTGEAKFVRSLCYFYLTNLFGNIPILLTTDYRLNAIATASTPDQVYQQIITDLTSAKELLSENYLSADRIRANKWAASALLARVYLYRKDWVNAERESSLVIARSSQYQLRPDLDQVFLKNSTEAILQLYVIGTPGNTYEGSYFILTAAPTTSNGVTISNQLLSAFQPGDLRSTKWVGTFTSGNTSYKFPYKYKVKTGATPVNEYLMVLRLAEQYLIRAEALINQDKVDEGVADLNIVRTRARATATIAIPQPLPNLADGMSKSNALLVVEQERRIELFAEWGHRWLDLKRTGRADAILKPLKGANWQTTDELYPIPATELINNPNLKPNPGY